MWVHAYMCDVVVRCLIRLGLASLHTCTTHANTLPKLELAKCEPVQHRRHPASLAAGAVALNHYRSAFAFAAPAPIYATAAATAATAAPTGHTCTGDDERRHQVLRRPFC